jgi:hypothetical protein
MAGRRYGTKQVIGVLETTGKGDGEQLASPWSQQEFLFSQTTAAVHSLK